MSAARWITRSLAAATVVVVLSAGCGSSPETDRATSDAAGAEQGRELVDEGTPVPGGTMRIGVPALANAGWHPFADNWETAGHLIGSSVLETLTSYGLDGEIEMVLATSVEPNDDLTSWTITLRDGVTFHDGTPMDADAVVANLEAATTTGLASIAFTGPVGVERIEAVDERTVVLELDTPTAVVPEILAGVAGYVAAPSMLADPAGALEPVGTGPFRLDEWVPDSHLSAVRYDDYWQSDADGQRLPYLDAVRFEIVPDPSSRRSALAAGDLDMILTTDASTLADARNDDSVISVEDSFSEETFVMLNSEVPPFDNRHAREALAYGTNVDEVIAATQDGVATAATSPWASGTPWEVDDPRYVTYDPERAQEAIAAYEAETGEPLRFSIDAIPEAGATEVQDLLVEGWGRLGIEAEAEVLEPVPYVAGITVGAYQAAWYRNYSHTDPFYMYVFFHSFFAKEPGALSTNFSKVRDDELDALVLEGMSTADPAKRRAVYAEVAREINDQLVDIWLFHTPFGLVARPEVRGLNHARAIGFASIEAKPWIGDLWLDDA